MFFVHAGYYIVNLCLPGQCVTDLNIELQEAKDEVGRLIANWRTLLDAMPEMVFLLRDDGLVEYQNRSSGNCFGDVTARDREDDVPGLKGFDLEGLAECCGNHGDGGYVLAEALINEVPVEYSVAPFAGYSGDRLFMVVMRDVSKRKQHEKERRDFNTHVEVILRKKIIELKESEKLRKRLATQLNILKGKLGVYHEADQMVGSSRIMEELREMIHQVAKSDATVLITGESGTGKELVANLVKAISNRNENPFLKINCNSINDSILESELFGYEKGAFTGASTRKKGKFEVVDKGTIFLDEIGDISPRMQASLLRVLQNGEVVRVGGTEVVTVDVRVIAATNIELGDAVKEKKFRRDLYYRLNIINIHIPPLRERKEDIVELVSHFIKHYRFAFKKDIDFVPQSIINRLLEHDWPGNVRELENLIQRAVLMAKGKMITEADLHFDNCADSRHNDTPRPDLKNIIGTQPLKAIIAEFEAEVIRLALHNCNGNVATAANELKVGKTALYDKMARYSISVRGMKKK